jgi:hypothetical protein
VTGSWCRNNVRAVSIYGFFYQVKVGCCRWYSGFESHFVSTKIVSNFEFPNYFNRVNVKYQKEDFPHFTLQTPHDSHRTQKLMLRRLSNACRTLFYKHFFSSRNRITFLINNRSFFNHNEQATLSSPLRIKSN